MNSLILQIVIIIVIIVIVVASLSENVQGNPLYIPSLLNNLTMKLLVIYSILHISLHNIFVEKEKYHKL